MKDLVCFDRLEVGPPQLKGNRLVAEYRVFMPNGETAATQMIFRFEEEVFDPDNPADRNLAAMMAAQVAVNYGLFCRAIVFHGPHDRRDAHFLKHMTENTAREILVKKFIEPNPFLLESWTGVDATPRKLYSRAELLFPDFTEAVRGKPRIPHNPSHPRYMVLSSGGKDSLLSFGLLRELGKEVHPVFGNESGRHWSTALNGYRHFKENIPGTARVWINSDRVFSWMLRRMPGIRKDFATLRSDEYPIRLWTVAVFLFAALPLALRRGVGRIIVGDEFDTTLRVATGGIRHFNGLYDQSRYFDEALTRYYSRKRWPLVQFSLLRPMSELLIQKTLAQRYPDLLTLQVSCHAALRGEDSRVLPCGRCEKCRRIMGMLSALGEDPGRLGYTSRQTDRAIAELLPRGVHQESAGARHMIRLLQQRGLLPRGPGGASRPEVLQLRFDAEHSPLNGIPVDLRGPLYSILLQNADGAVRRVSRRWREFDLLNDASARVAGPCDRDIPDFS